MLLPFDVWNVIIVFAHPRLKKALRLTCKELRVLVDKASVYSLALNSTPQNLEFVNTMCQKEVLKTTPSFQHCTFFLTRQNVRLAPQLFAGPLACVRTVHFVEVLKWYPVLPLIPRTLSILPPTVHTIGFDTEKTNLHEEVDSKIVWKLPPNVKTLEMKGRYDLLQHLEIPDTVVFDTVPSHKPHHFLFCTVRLPLRHSDTTVVVQIKEKKNRDGALASLEHYKNMLAPQKSAVVTSPVEWHCVRMSFAPGADIPSKLLDCYYERWYAHLIPTKVVFQQCKFSEGYEDQWDAWRSSYRKLSFEFQDPIIVPIKTIASVAQTKATVTDAESKNKTVTLVTQAQAKKETSTNSEKKTAQKPTKAKATGKVKAPGKQHSKENRAPQNC